VKVTRYRHYHMCVDTIIEPQLYSPKAIIEYIIEIDSVGRRVRKECKDLFSPLGLDFEKPPVEPFPRLADKQIGLTHFRSVILLHMMRIFWCSVANEYLCAILNGLSDRSQPTRDAWIDLQQSFERTAQCEADHLLVYVPVYVTPGDGPLNPMTLSSLVWPLSTFGASRLLTLLQKMRAKEALLQIGSRASVAIATKLADSFFQPNFELSKEAHMLHQAWHF
jgi:hypothetical protein